VSKKKGLVKSGCRRTGLSIIAYRSVSNAVCSSLFQCQVVVRWVNWSSGRAIFD
jgi:hypothetical protein